MVESGEITTAEAADLRAAENTEQFDDAVGAVRVRHAGPKLDAAVADGVMTAAEADENRKRIANGEHPRGLRAHLRKTIT